MLVTILVLGVQKDHQILLKRWYVFPCPFVRVSHLTSRLLQCANAPVQVTIENGFRAEVTIEIFSIDQVLKVEVIMGLHCIGFNSELYEPEALDRRFQDSQPVLGKREGSELEGSEPH